MKFNWNKNGWFDAYFLIRCVEVAMYVYVLIFVLFMIHNDYYT